MKDSFSPAKKRSNTVSCQPEAVGLNGPVVPRPKGIRGLNFGMAMTLLFVVLPLFGLAEEDAPMAERTEVRFAFSTSMFAGVNENDAQAAIKVYTQNIGDQNGIYVNTAPELLDGTNAIVKALDLKKADLLVLTADEFFTLEHQGLEGPLLLSQIGRTFTEDYLLLTREESTLRRVEDLKGRSLNVPSDSRGGLSRIWLEVLCHEHALGPAAQTLAKITAAAKTTQVVLPVFFGKADACIVTRNGWEVMCELNPQLKKQLRIVAVSPPVVPSLTCFRRGFTEAFRQQVIKAVELSSTKPAFKQLMALFKTDGLGYEPVAALDSTRALVANYHQLGRGTNGVSVGGREPGLSPNLSEPTGK